MKRSFIVFVTIGIVIVGLTFGLIKMKSESLRLWIPPQWRNFEDLDIVDKSVLQFDSVYGDYLKWFGRKFLGTGTPDSITRQLLLDKSNKFAIKAIFKDTTGFFSKIPGDIDFSGRWTEKDGRVTLKFYFVPETWHQLFDSIKNDKVIKFIDNETIEIDKNATEIWIMDTECKKLK